MLRHVEGCTDPAVGISKVILIPEDGESTLVRNIGKSLPRGIWSQRYYVSTFLRDDVTFSALTWGKGSIAGGVLGIFQVT